MQTTSPKKRLTKIRLINWHFFTDETITVEGSVLFSGENASGKSTILDAIQLVLTTNSTRFNPAANEKSRRDLRGYVRCKTGEEGNTYVRSQGAVISYVALEFYEESKENTFVLGVKLDSPDVEAEITKKWFVAEGRMESITFIVDGKPAMDKEFTQAGKKISFENQVGRARDLFRIRLGRLDDTFQSMIIKSMAFKPMDHVKDFINQFILPKNVIRTEVLQENIRNLREMQKLINEVRAQIEQLHRITDRADEIEEIDGKILVVDILLAIATLAHQRQQMEEARQALSRDEALLASLKDKKLQCEDTLASAQKLFHELSVAMASNECGRLIEKLEEELRTLGAEKARQETAKAEFVKQVKAIGEACKGINLQTEAFRVLTASEASTEEKTGALEEIIATLTAKREELYTTKAVTEGSLKAVTGQIRDLEERVSQLKKNRPVYDPNTTMLLSAINEEFAARKIQAEARIFAELLEIEMPAWRDAVEGYLNTQRFHILVEPAYYDIAAEVYDRLKGKIHSAGVVNMEKILREAPERTEGSLAEAVSSENRYAVAYANYLLGRVTRCETVLELKQHSIAITKECMKYQGHVLSKIRPEIYKNPFIGKGAIRIQLQNAEKELLTCREQKNLLEAQAADSQRQLDYINRCYFDTAKSRIGASESLREIRVRMERTESELKEAKNNPTFIELSLRRDEAERALRAAQRENEAAGSRITNKERDIEDGRKRLSAAAVLLSEAERAKNAVAEGHEKAAAEAQARYAESIRKKDAGEVAENYGPRRKTLENQRAAALQKLIEYQAKYKDGDFGTGLEVMDIYREDLQKLERGDLISYEDRLKKAQEDCELEFRENFLAKMRENIERAETIFAQLNRSLRGIYYGNDSYKFELSANKERQSLYDMITSDINIAGQTLFSSMFEDKYHAEMEDLFSRLTDENLADTAVMEELTDYRSYLDYDIQIVSKDGRMQRFSKTYGEKSGGETQTPYYVSIAASFAQMYSGRETVRILMLDEAFNNMDEDRIESMMKFFQSQNFQVILAAPPSRMETIGEYVDSIFLAIHKGQVSTIEEYYL